MAIFFQQSGKRGEADFVKTLVTPDRELRLFTGADLLERHGFHITSEALHYLPSETGFQIWGVPSGAYRYIKQMGPRDLFLPIGQPGILH